MPPEIDPLASLTTWPIEFVLGDHLYVIEPQPATGWLLRLLDELGSFESIIELLPIRDKAQIEQDIIDEIVTDGDVEQTFRDAVEAVAGRPWWMVLNYLSLAKSFWSRFHGRALMSGLDPAKVSLGAYLDALYFAFIEGRENEALQKINNFLETPPAGLGIELDEEAEGDTFLAMMNQAR